MRTPRSPWDAAWKALVERVFHPWLEFFFPAVAAHVDPSHPPEFLDTELQKIAPRATRGRSHVDRLVKVRLRDGTPGLLLIHIEIQSQKDPWFPRRVLLYHCTLLLHYDLPVTSLALLADTSPGWKPDRTVLEAPGTRLTLEFSVCKLLERDPGPPVDGEPMLNHVVRAWRMTRDTSGDAKGRQDGKIRLFRALVRAARTEGCSQDQALAAVRFLETVAALPEKLEEEYTMERNQILVKENLDILTYGEKKAFREGKLEGRREGQREGTENAQRENAVRMRDLGMDLPTIARCLGLSRKRVASLLEGSAEVGSSPVGGEASRP